jgi:hypothetical protein
MPGWRWSWAAMVCCCGHLLAASAAASFPPQPPPNETRGMSRHRVLDSQAVCNDGSPAYFYWRNCTANSDRAPGDKQDYCAKGGKEGVDQVVWMLVFESAGFCYDARSCAARESHRTSSSWLPPTIFPSGGLSCFPEENPNFYKATTVFVPSCSSDLWLGDAAHSLGGSGGSGRTFFRGRRILSAVLRQLARPLAGADVLVIAGSAGVMAALHSPTVTALLPARLQVRLVCDGCLLSAAPPLRSVAQQPCTTDTDCPPKEALVSPSSRSTDISAPHPTDKSISPRTDRCAQARAAPIWNSSALLGPGCPGGRCLLEGAMLQTMGRRWPALVFQDLQASSQLRALRAWPAPPGSAARDYALALGALTQQRLAQASAAAATAAAAAGARRWARGQLLVFAPACTGPPPPPPPPPRDGSGAPMRSLLASDGSAFVDQMQYYGVGVAAKNRFNVSVTTSYSDMVYSLVEGEGCAAGGASHCQCWPAGRMTACAGGDNGIAKRWNRREISVG